MIKNKKFILSILSIILAVILSVATVGCNKTVVLPSDNFAATEIDLVKNGQTDYSIVISENATNYEQYAAEELQLYLKDSTNATLPIITDAGKTFNSSEKVISVGETKIKDGSGLTVPYDEFKRDGFKIKRFNNTLVLCGGGGYGTLYAVYEFLYREIDWEAYAADEIYYKKTLNLKVLDIDFADKPAIENRYGGWYSAAKDAYYAAKQRTFAGVDGMLFNETTWYCYPHAVFKLVNPEEYREDHPDWYSASGGQPCYSSEGFRAQLIENIKKLILNNPSIIYIPLGPEDELNQICTRPPNECNCRHEQELYTYTGQVIRFVNSVAAELEEWRVEQGIERKIYYPLLAYYETRFPPLDRTAEAGVYKPIDESCVLSELSPVIYAPLEADFSRPLDDPYYNKAALNDLEGWLVCSKSLMAYYYNQSFFEHFDWNYVPIETVVHNYKLAVDYGAIQLGDDASNGSLAGCAFQTMQGYIYSKVMWNPNVSVPELIKNYINMYYKDAKEEILEYYYLMEMTRTIVVDNNDAIGKTDTATKDWLNKGLLERAVSLIKKGLEDIKNNPNHTDIERQKYIKRVELELLTPLVYILDNFPNEYNTTPYLAIVDEVEELVNKYALTITATYSYSKTNEVKFSEWRKKGQ